MIWSFTPISYHIIVFVSNQTSLLSTLTFEIEQFLLDLVTFTHSQKMTRIKLLPLMSCHFVIKSRTAIFLMHMLV